MKVSWILRGAGEELQTLKYEGSGGEAEKTVSPVLTVKEVCRRLGKSRRQVYRYLKEGRLRACARILDQWLFGSGDVSRFSEQELPRFLRPFFWDVRLSTLSQDRHRDFILSRILELGDRAAIRWVLRQYPRREVIAFLKGPGARRLSQRAWRFWAVVLGVKARRTPSASWRLRGRHWGGLP